MKAGIGKKQRDRKRTEERKKESKKETKKETKKQTNKGRKEGRKNLQRCQRCPVTVITVPLVTPILGHSGRVSTACFNGVFQM